MLRREGSQKHLARDNRREGKKGGNNEERVLVEIFFRESLRDSQGKVPKPESLSARK